MSQLSPSDDALAGDVPPMDAPQQVTMCKHCQDPVPASSPAAPDFCCTGCKGAYALLQGQGLAAYYQRRAIDPDQKSLKPDAADQAQDFSAYIFPATDAAGGHVLHLMIEGLHCAACVWLIESLLRKQDGVIKGRVNMTTRRLTLQWQGDAARATDILAPVQAIGYRLIPYDPAILGQETRKQERQLLKAMAVAGFGAANVMLFSVSVWFGGKDDVYTRDLLHLLSALITFPCVFYAIRPFARSAFTALKARRMNMDVPITLAVLLATGISLLQTFRSAEHAYFDSAITLLFFLLIGRFLESRAKGQARSAAEHLLALGAGAVTILHPDGSRQQLRPVDVQVGMQMLVAAGERIPLDGTILRGQSDVDTSLITGETLPETVQPESKVFAGTLNRTAPLTIRVDAVGEQTLLAEIVRLMEAAEQGRARYVSIADRMARYYAPFVHTLAALAFLGWWQGMGVSWLDALLIAVAVLIITCPCALALAVPVVQVIASGRLLKQGVLVKSATALERLKPVSAVVFDKTGTLTTGRLQLQPPDPMKAQAGLHWGGDDYQLAAAIAANSQHPLARALVRADMEGTLPQAEQRPPAVLADAVVEIPGQGMMWQEVRLGRRTFCGVPEDTNNDAAGPEIWLKQPGKQAVCFTFTDELRPDAAETIEALHARGIPTYLLSGDRYPVVSRVAQVLGIYNVEGQCTPAEKVEYIEGLRSTGAHVLMVGDGLNDAPALAAASVSMSPATAMHVTQTAADMVIQGEKLAPVLEAMDVAQKADALVRQNFALAFIYNIVTIPLAMIGVVTPLIAAAAMSGSSITVICNAMRLTQRRKKTP
jgi:Cu2+-exporting ATPase